MSLFASRPSASIYEPNYSGLFRLIDEFNNYAAEANNSSDAAAPASTDNSVASTGANSNPAKRRSLQNSLPLWTPKFDLHETPNTYVLHGEFPGVDKKDINIEFTDEQTLSIRGRSERAATHSSDDDDDVVMVQGQSKDRQAGNEAEHQDKSKQQQVSTQKQQQQQQQPKLKYWVSERSFGEFARSFTFPTRVDASGAVAKLDNGVLNLVVPKASKPRGKKITVF